MPRDLVQSARMVIPLTYSRRGLPRRKCVELRITYELADGICEAGNRSQYGGREELDLGNIQSQRAFSSGYFVPFYKA